MTSVPREGDIFSQECGVTREALPLSPILIILLLAVLC